MKKKNYMTDFTCLCEKVKDFSEACKMKPKYKITKVLFVYLSAEEIEELAYNEKVFDITDYSKNNYSKVICFIKEETLYVASDAVIVLTKCATLFGEYTGGNKEEYFNHNLFFDVKEMIFENMDTSEVDNMSNMFISLKKVKSLDLSSFDTSNVKSMSGMFSNCISLEEVNLKSFNTLKVKNMDSMFSNCESLKKLDLSSFKTDSLMYMNEMFRCCFSLESLDLSNVSFEKIKLTKVSGREYPSRELFNGLPNNTKIIVKDEKNKDFVLKAIKSTKTKEDNLNFFDEYCESYKITEEEKNEIIKSIMRINPNYPKWNDNNFILKEKK